MSLFIIMMVRLDKFLADGMDLTRTQAKELIRSGRVKVSGVTERDPGRKVDPDQDRVQAGDEVIGVFARRILMLNKPAGVVSAVRDAKLPTVLDLVDKSMRGKKGIAPVGRLDRDTEGLLLLTDDGELAHRLLSPARHVPKTYQALLEGEIKEEQIRAFEGGLDIGDEKDTLPARLQILEQRNGVSFAEITITEGRYHQIKRMAAAIGCRVLYLRRIGMGELRLDLELKKGQVRPLTSREEALIN